MIMRKTKLLTLFVLLTVAMGAMAQAGFTFDQAFYVGRAAYSVDDPAIVAPSTEWTVGDELFVYGVSKDTHDQVLMGILTATEAGPVTPMEGTLDLSQTGTKVPMTLTLSNLKLPLDYRGTDGSLDNARSYATATVTVTAINEDEKTVTLDDAKPTLQLRQALVKVTLQDSNGNPLVPSWLKSDLHNVSGNYSTINLLHQNMPVDGAGDWIFGGATYENGTITLPKEGGCGCGWKPEFWDQDLTQHTGIVVKFDQPINQDCNFCVAYTMEGDAEQYYDSYYVSQGSTMAWAGVPWYANKINGVYFSLGGEVDEDVIIKPIDFWFNYPDAYYFGPTSNEFYLPLNGMETGSNLSFEADVNGKKYAFSADDVTYQEGSYYEESFKLDETIKLTLNPAPFEGNVKVDGLYKYPDYYTGTVELLPNQTVTLESYWAYRFKSVNKVTPVMYAVPENPDNTLVYQSGETVDVKNGDDTAVSITFGEAGGANFVIKPNYNIYGYSYYTPGNGTNGNKEGGTFYTIKPYSDGTITVAVYLNAGKKFFIEEDGTPLDGYNGITVEELYCGNYSFKVSAGKKYKVYASGSKLGFYGLKFIPAVVTSDLVVNYNSDKSTASFQMPASDLDVGYTLSRYLGTDVGMTVNGVSNYNTFPRIPVKQNDEGKYEPVNPLVFTLYDYYLNKEIDNTDYTLEQIYQWDYEHGWTLMNDGDEYSPGEYRAVFTATETSDYVGTYYCYFDLIEGYSVYVPAREYITFYSNDALTVADSDIKLYTITEVGETEATLAEITSANAQMPFLVYNSSDYDKIILLNPTGTEINQAVAKEFKGTLYGETLAASDASTNNYVFNGNAFVWVKNAMYIGANKCWLEIPNALSARTITLVNSNTTGIDSIDHGTLTIDHYYDLNGRKLDKMPTKKGVYVKNGKKVVIK